MSLTTEQLKRIASLSKLELSDKEQDSTLNKLNGIFYLIEKMQSVNTSGIVPMSHPQDVAQRLREDGVTEHNQREIYQQPAPETDGGLYLVPKVIE